MSTRRCACGARLSWPTATNCSDCQLRGRWERLYQAEDDRQRHERDRQVVDQLAADRARVDREVAALLSRSVGHTAPAKPATIAPSQLSEDTVWAQMQAAASRRDWPEHRRLQAQLIKLKDARR